MVATITTHFSRGLVLSAAALAAAVVLSLTCYAYWTETDFTYSNGILVMGMAAIFVAGVIQIFWKASWLHLGISLFGVLLFGVYLIYDTQKLLGDKGNIYSLDDYILASLNIYTDVIQIFLYLLQVLGGSDDGE